MYRNVVVAYDGSEGARAALERAAELAQAGGASLTLVESTTDPVDGLLPGARRSVPRVVEARARHTLEDAIADLDPELAASPWLVAGPAARGIIAVAGEIGADLIVTGSRGRGRVARTVLGSVSSEIVHDSPCDVLVAHPRDGA